MIVAKEYFIGWQNDCNVSEMVRVAKCP